MAPAIAAAVNPAGTNAPAAGLPGSATAALGTLERLPAEPRVWEYAPASPNFPRDSPLLAAHTLPYVPRRTPAATTATYNRSLGDHKAVMVLAQFPDVTHQAGNNQSKYDAFANANASLDLSMRTFYYEDSAGRFTLNTTVSTWVTLPHNMSYYSTASGEVQLLADAANAADSQIDFSDFDENGDGDVDNFVVLHAGNDQAVSTDANDIWSFMGTGTAVQLDGKWIRVFCAVAEEAPLGDPLGVVVHEFAHLAFDLPDLYDVDFNNAGIGDWDTMATGLWGGGGNFPNHFSAWTKLELGWVDPFVPPSLVNNYTIYPMTNMTARNPVKLESNFSDEYFLVEFRHRNMSLRYDAYLPSSGLVIYHVDETVIANRWASNTVETDTAHKGIDIEEVGAQDMDTAPDNTGDTNDRWLNNATGFTPDSTPNSNLYRNAGAYATGIRIFDISAVLTAGDPHMNFSIDPGRVSFSLTGTALNGSLKSAVPGATATFEVEFSTFSVTGDSVNLTVEGNFGGSLVSLNRTSLTLPSLGSGTVELTVSLPAGCAAGDIVEVRVRATSTTQPTSSFAVLTRTLCGQVYLMALTGIVNFTAEPAVPLARNFTLTNTGNGNDTAAVSATFDARLLDVSIATQPPAIGPGSSSVVGVSFAVDASVTAGTMIPYSLQVSYGDAGDLRHLSLNGTITAGQAGELSLVLDAQSVERLDAGVPRVFNVTVYNNANFLIHVDLSATAPAGIAVQFESNSIDLSAFANGSLTVTVKADRDTPAFTTGELRVVADRTPPAATEAASLTVQVAQRFELELMGDTSITAAPGEAAVFHLVTSNLGNGRDNVTLEMTSIPVGWNASFVPTGVSLGASSGTNRSSILLTIGVAPNAASGTLQNFTAILRSQQAGVSVSWRVTVRVLLPSSQIHAFNMTADRSLASATGGADVTFLVTVQNVGNVQDAYSLALAGVPIGWNWTVIGGFTHTIAPQASVTVSLVVTTAEGTLARSFDMQIVVNASGGAATSKSLPVTVAINERRELRLVAAAVEGVFEPGATVTVALTLVNLGNVGETVRLDGSGPFASISYDPRQLQVDPFGQATASVSIVLRGDQPPGNVTFAVRATSVADSSRTTQAQLGVQVGPPTAPGTNEPPGPPPGFSALLADANLLLALIAAGAAAGIAIVLARRRRNQGGGGTG